MIFDLSELDIFGHSSLGFPFGSCEVRRLYTSTNQVLVHPPLDPSVSEWNMGVYDPKKAFITLEDEVGSYLKAPNAEIINIKTLEMDTPFAISVHYYNPKNNILKFNSFSKLCDRLNLECTSTPPADWSKIILYFSSIRIKQPVNVGTYFFYKDSWVPIKD